MIYIEQIGRYTTKFHKDGKVIEMHGPMDFREIISQFEGDRDIILDKKYFLNLSTEAKRMLQDLMIRGGLKLKTGTARVYPKTRVEVYCGGPLDGQDSQS